MDIRSFFGKKPGGGGDGGKKKEEKEKKKPSKPAEPVAVAMEEGDDGSEEIGAVGSPAAAGGKRRAVATEGSAGSTGGSSKGKKKTTKEAVVPIDLSSDDDSGSRSSARRATHSRQAKGKRKKIVEEESDEEEEEEAWDAPSDSEEEESEDDEDFGASSKKKKKKKKGGKKAATKKKAKREEAPSPSSANPAASASARSTRASGPAAPSPATKKRTETSAADYFSAATRSQFFGGEPDSPAPSVEQPKPKAEATPSPSLVKKKEAPVKMEVVEVDESEEEKPAAAAVKKEETPSGKVKKEEEAATAAVSTPSPAGAASTTAASSIKKEGGGAPRAWNQPRQGALNPGCRPIPEGKPNCLDGKTFVLTGVTESLDRTGMEDLIKQYGGRVTSSVSKKTSYLVVGLVLEDGRAVEEGKKHKSAKQLGVRIISEEQLFDMIAKTKSVVKQEPKKEEEDSKPSSAVPAYEPGAPPPRKPPSPARPLVPSSSASPLAGGGGAESELWTDKYAPKAMSDLIGGAGLAAKLANWLKDWDAVHNKKTKPPPAPSGQQRQENPGAKAALLSGPPGIGKSTTAALVARLQGFSVYELNASDTRNKKTLQQELSDAITNTALPTLAAPSAASSSSMGGKGKGPPLPPAKQGGGKRVIIMDEVDGMGGNNDRGGVQELIQMIKKSKVPIVCICNDRGHPKIRSLANHCYDLRFHRPQKGMVANRMVEVARREGLTADRNAIEHLVEAVGNDVRQVLNTLQMWAKSSDRMTYLDVKARMGGIDKDKTLRMSAFDSCRQILCESRSAPFLDRYNAFFVDYSLMPLLVQQNYLDAVKNRKDSLTARIEAMQLAADAVSDADLAGALIMGGDQHWELLPLQAALTVKVGHHAGGGFGFPQFPQWLGKNSTTNKRRRLLHELSVHLAGRVTGATQAIRLDYIPALRTRLLGMLRGEGEGVQGAIALLDAYGLSRDDLMETMTEMTIAEGKPDPLAGIDSKTKAAFTREYNKGSHKAQGLAWHQGAKVTKKRGGGGGGLGLTGGAGAVDEEGAPLETEAGADDESTATGGGNGEEEEEDEEVDLSAFVKKGKKGGGGGKAATASSSSAAGGGGGKGKRKGGGKGKGAKKK